MTKDQIRAELRRSATEDDVPWAQVRFAAYAFARAWELPSRSVWSDNQNTTRIFFLFVAEAM